MKLTALIISLVIASFFDIKSYKIPNWLILIMFVLGASFSFYEQGVLAINSLLVAFLVLILGFSLWSFGKIVGFNIFGAGDIKLFSTLPLFVSLKFLLYIIPAFTILIIIINTKAETIRNVLVKLRSLMNLFFFGIPIETEEKGTKVYLAPYLLASTIILILYNYYGGGVLG